MFKNILLICCLLAIPHFLGAQTSRDRTTVIPPSPTSAVFSKYGDNQPSLQAGTVNIPISLMNVKAHGIDIPLSLTYQTSGINAMDTPYPAGYGWVLSSGFRITRTVLGRPDERFTFRQSDAGEEYAALKPGILSEGLYSAHQLASTDLFDTQKDIFNVLLPSGSFKFFINKVGSSFEAVTIGTQKKVEVLIASGGFKVTDESGIIYVFGYDGSTSATDYSERPGSDPITAWVLREIILLNNEKITFSWLTVNTNTYVMQTSTPITVIDYKNLSCNWSGNTMHEINDPGGMTQYDSYTNVLMLKKIEYPSGTVDLTYKSASDPFIQSIVAKNRNNDIIKTVNFTYGSANSTQDNLLLQSLKVNEELYTFQYNANRFTRNSTSLDYWGFYNGKSNTTLIPAMTLKLYSGVGGLGAPPNVDQPVGYADRSPSATHMKAFMLTRINYPTGGYSEYDYEPHQFAAYAAQSTGFFATSPATISMGGGLRVKQITSYPLPISTPITKVYKYGNGEDGLANNVLVPTLDTFIDEFWQVTESTICPNSTVSRTLVINALSNYSKYVVDRNPIWYSKVAEYVNELKTEYAYLYGDDGVYWDVNAHVVKTPYVWNYNNLFNSGPYLWRNTIYRKEGGNHVPVKMIVNEYEMISYENKRINNLIIDRSVIFSSAGLSGGPDLYPDNLYSPSFPVIPNEIAVKYHAIPYSIFAQYNRLSKVKTIMHHGTDSLVDSTAYFYNDPQLIKTVKSSSIPEKNISTEFKYANDFTDPVYLDMVAKNMFMPVVEETTSVGSTVIKKIKTNYTNNTAITTGLVMPGSVETSSSASGPFTTEATYEQYDAKGNIIQSSVLKGAKTAYLWSYAGQYPVAEIKNASISEVIAAMGGQSSVDTFRDNPAPDVNTILSGLRAALPGALITTFTYKPLVGMTSRMDAKGLSSFYEYDANSRLKRIRDHNGNIVKTYDYHYKQ